MGTMKVATVDEVMGQAGAEPRIVLRSVLPFGKSWRVGVLGADGRFPPRFDGFVARADFDALVERVKPVAVGAWNPGYAHGSSLAWWGGNGDWRCVASDGTVLASVGADSVVVGGRPLARLDIDCVEMSVAPGWERREIRVCPFDEEPVVLFSEEDAAPSVDPAYDLEMLDTDTAWLTALSAALAQAVGRPSFRRVAPR